MAIIRMAIYSGVNIVISILGCSHYCFGVNAGIVDEKRIFFNGYISKFTEHALQPQREKKQFMRFKTVSHSMQFLQHPTHPSIELLAHHAICYTPTTPMYSFKDDLTVSIKTKNKEKSIDFWKNVMGFHKISENKLHLNALMPTWTVNIEISQCDDVEMPYIDDGNLSCLSFLVRDINACLQSMESLKNQFTLIGSPFSLTINKRTVNAFFARGPQEELVEFISIF